MKRTILFSILLTMVLSLSAQKPAKMISYIEQTRSWYYIYDQDGKRVRGISSSQGELAGYGATFYILKQGTSFYVIYDIQGHRIASLSVSNVGEIMSVSGETFTSRKGNWIYTWSREGKKLSSRSAH